MRRRFRFFSTYWLALLVGTLINLYGHLLIPALHGDAEPLADFFWKLLHEPLTMGGAVVGAYIFPLLVGVYASVRAELSCPRCQERDTLSEEAHGQGVADPSL